MAVPHDPPTIDMIRWTFSVDPRRRPSIEAHLADLGLDVFVQGEGQFHVSWDEPDRDMDELIVELWDLAGSPFEITQEEFHRVSLSLLQHHDDEADAVAA